MGSALYTLADLAAAFAAAVSGALAAKQHRLDLFGVYMIAFITAVAGGVFRDLSIGALPPVGLADWRYLTAAMLAATLAVWGDRLLHAMRNPVLFFDALGLGFYAVVGAQKALLFGCNAQTAILLGMFTAVGGGMMRDVLLNRVPAILEREIYASAALAGAAVQVAGERLGWPIALTPWFAISVCIAIRLLSLRFGWQLQLPQRSR